MRVLPLTRRVLASSAASALLITKAVAKTVTAPEPATTASSAGFGTSVTTIYTGAHSHWLQPWRTMVATRSFATFQNGIGLNCDPSYASSLAMFAEYGFRHLRVAVFWSLVDYDAPSTISLADNASTVTFIRAAKAAGLRPLILLQAFDQGPCPYETITVTATNAIGSADTTITLSSTAGLVVGRSGLTGYETSPTASSITFVSPTQVMCNALITAIDGNQVTLSKPASADIPAGTTLVLNTLLYKPWSEIGTTDYETTMAGWTSYLGAVSTFMQSVLGTAGSSDLGFDIEIWNETSFGSDFLDINNYYSTPVVAEQYVDGIPAVIPDIVAQSSAYILANPSQFSGVSVSDGFASVSPMQAASTEPAAVNVLSKHPYPSPVSYPASDPGTGGLDAQGNATSFIPSYTIYTHEYFSTAINPFTLARDISTVTNDFGGVDHGQHARTIDGAVAPVSVWLTEFGTASEGVTDPTAIARLTTKGALRGFFFNLGIGVERLYVYTGVGDTTDLALVPSSAPTTPTLPLQAIRNALSFMQGGVTKAAGTLNAFTTEVSLFSGDAATLFTGNGTAACPDFVQPSDFVLVPVQVTPTRTAFLLWFTALDMRQDMPALGVSLLIDGFSSAATATVSAYDPLNNQSVTTAVWGQNATAIAVGTYVADTPVILLVDQG